MFCSKCGNQISEDALFCNKCGSKIREETAKPVSEPPVSEPPVSEQPVSEQPVSEPPVSEQPVSEQPVSEQPVSEPPVSEQPAVQPVAAVQKSKKWVVIPVVVAVLVAVIGVGALNVVNGKIPNAIRKATMSDAEYIQYILRNGKDTLFSVTENVSAETEDGVSVTESVGMSLSDEGKEFLEDLGADKDAVEWIKEASAEITVNNDPDAEKSEIKVSATLNGKDLGDGSAVIDYADSLIYLSVPDYMDAICGEDNVTNGFYYNGALTTCSEVASTYLFRSMGGSRKSILGLAETEKGQELLSEYLETVISHLNNVEKKEADLSARGVSQSCTEYAITVDYDTFYNCAEALLLKAQKDEKLKALISEYAEALDEQYEELSEEYGYEIDFDPEEYVESLYDMLDELSDALEDVDESDFDDYRFALNVYVDNGGKICGFEIIGAEIRYDELYSGIEIDVYMPTVKSEFGFELDIEEFEYGDKENLVSLKGNGTCKGKKYAGEFAFSIEGEKALNLSFEDVNLSDWLQGELNGKFVLTPRQYILDEADFLKGLSLVICPEGNSESLKLEISVLKSDDTLATFSYACSYGKQSKITLPSNAISWDDFDPEMDIDSEKIEEVLKEAGMPEDIITSFFEDFFSLGYAEVY